MVVTFEDCVARLSMLGYTVSEGQDEDHLQFEIDKILDYAANHCNLESADKLPDLMSKRTIDRICAEFLYTKKNSGQLEGFDYEKCLKTIEQGDTKITFAVGQEEDTPETRFDRVVDNLTKGYDKWICKYRVIRW